VGKDTSRATITAGATQPPAWRALICLPATHCLPSLPARCTFFCFFTVFRTLHLCGRLRFHKIAYRHVPSKTYLLAKNTCSCCNIPIPIQPISLPRAARCLRLPGTGRGGGGGCRHACPPRTWPGQGWEGGQHGSWLWTGVGAGGGCCSGPPATSFTAHCARASRPSPAAPLLARPHPASPFSLLLTSAPVSLTAPHLPPSQHGYEEG